MPGQIEGKFSAVLPEGSSEKKAENVKAIKKAETRGTDPIIETENNVSYLGVKLEKAKDKKGKYVPRREDYSDYISDEFLLNLQKKIAVSFSQGDPILIEGGTSIGKTTTVRKMCSELGWEVHYVNLHGAIDVEDLMGKYISNPYKVDRKNYTDEQYEKIVNQWAKHTQKMDPSILGGSEYIFADGQVISGLRQEEGKIKVIILDELNSAPDNVLIRLHSVIDNLERNGNEILTEDASEMVPVSKEKTKVIALMNPPGKGYFKREPIDPAQLRRWVYQKEAAELPRSSFSYRRKAIRGLLPKTETVSQEKFMYSRETPLYVEQLNEIPGYDEIEDRYEEFHYAAKELIKNRQIAEDQPQLFTFDDAMELRRIRDFILKFYNGDINETFQNALRYYYSNKIESKADRDKLEELIAHVAYVPAPETKRKPLDDKETEGESALKSQAEKELADLMASADIPEGVKAALGGKETMLSPDILEQVKEAKTIFGQDFLGPDEIKSVFGAEALAEVPAIPFSREELERAKELGQILVLRQPFTMEQINESLGGKVKDGEKLLYSFDESTGKLKDDCWYKDEEFYKNEKPEAKWALVSKEVIPNSTGKNYLEQTDQIADHLTNQVFKDKPMPEKYQEAIDEYSKVKTKIDETMKSDWKKAAEMLEGLKITELCRQTPAEALYDLALYFQTTGERLLPDKWTWTSRRDSSGKLVDVGFFDTDGANVFWDKSANSFDALGVCFSRSL